MTDIVEKLTFWTVVYPEGMEKSDRHLYKEALDEILYLRSVIKANRSYPTLYTHCMRYLRGKR